jgi:glutathionylspermidine synthase
MRALLEPPAAPAADAYRCFVQQAQLRGLLADHLVQGEPYLALNAVVLQAAESELLGRLTETFSTAFLRAGARLARDVPALIEMGFPWIAAELLAAEPAAAPLVGRFDFLCDDAGHWWLLEFNADTPSGVREAIVADELAHASLSAAHGLGQPNRGLAPALVAAFESVAADLPPDRALGLVTSADELEDLAQMAFTQRLLAAPLGAHGVDVVLGDRDNLGRTRRGLTLCGRRLGALYRYVPFESLLGTPSFAAIYDAVASGRLRLLNGLFGLLLQHKGLLAWMWEHRADAMFTAAERAALQAHLPPTWGIDRYPCNVHPATLVAKQVFGREGEEVFFGEDTPPDVWDTLRHRRTYVAQQRIYSHELEATVASASGPQPLRGCPTVGAFAVQGRWAGYYTRFGGKITTSRAKWLATFVE